MRGFRTHVIAALAALLVLILINFLAAPGYPWWMWAAVAWSAPLAVHAGVAMELFGRRD